MANYLLGIDSGGTMTKAVLVTLGGVEVAVETRATQMLFPGAGQTERDPTAMWIATCEAINSVMVEAGVTGADVVAICATGYGSGIYCIDENGHPTRNGVVSTDTRAQNVVDDWKQKGLLDEARQTVLQAIWPAQSLTLLGWIQKFEPDVAKRTRYIIECKDFTKLRLTGNISTDYTDAAIGGLLDLRKGDYAHDLLEKLGLGQWNETLPPLISSERIAGEITQEAARQTGLKAGTPVVCGSIDIVASSLASGVTEESQISIVAGTWSINNLVHRAPQTSPIPFLQMPYPILDQYLACEASATSASNLEWVCQTLLEGDKDRAGKEGKTIYDVCNSMVEARRDKPPSITFFPYLYGGPGGARASFIGANASDEKGDLVYAVYEGIVFAHKTHVGDLLNSKTHVEPNVVRLAGGAARSDVWAQMFADVLRLPVEIADGKELGAHGACIMGAVGIGLHDTIADAVAGMVRVKKRFEPNAERSAMYEERYQRFTALSKALAPHW